MQIGVLFNLIDIILTILSIVLLMRALFLIEIQNNDDDMAHTHINDNFKIHP